MRYRSRGALRNSRNYFRTGYHRDVSRPASNRSLVRAGTSATSRRCTENSTETGTGAYYRREGRSLRRIRSEPGPVPSSAPGKLANFLSDGNREVQVPGLFQEQLVKSRNSSQSVGDGDLAKPPDNVNSDISARIDCFPSQNYRKEEGVELDPNPNVSNPHVYVKRGHSLKRVSVESKMNTLASKPLPVSTDLISRTSPDVRSANASRISSASQKQKHGMIQGPIAKPQTSKSRDMVLRKISTNLGMASQLAKTCGMLSRNKTLDKRKLQQCLFLTRFGKCKLSESCEGCPFLHDAATVGICRDWVAGHCKKSSDLCDLSHNLDKNKMPVCERYLQGHCALASTQCPYLHISHAADTPLCEAFAHRGYCRKGQKCDRVHTWDCLSFVRTWKCLAPDNCRLRHWPVQRRERAQMQTLSSHEEIGRPSADSVSSGDEGLPATPTCSAIVNNNASTSISPSISVAVSSRTDISSPSIGTLPEFTSRASTSRPDGYIPLL